jgi:hypothetical protein
MHVSRFETVSVKEAKILVPLFYLDDRDSRFLRNTVMYLPKYSYSMS